MHLDLAAHLLRLRSHCASATSAGSARQDRVRERLALFVDDARSLRCAASSTSRLRGLRRPRRSSASPNGGADAMSVPRPDDRGAVALEGGRSAPCRASGSFTAPVPAPSVVPVARLLEIGRRVGHRARPRTGPRRRSTLTEPRDRAGPTLSASSATTAAAIAPTDDRRAYISRGLLRRTTTRRSAVLARPAAARRTKPPRDLLRLRWSMSVDGPVLIAAAARRRHEAHRGRWICSSRGRCETTTLGRAARPATARFEPWAAESMTLRDRASSGGAREGIGSLAWSPLTQAFCPWAPAGRITARRGGGADRPARGA